MEKKLSISKSTAAYIAGFMDGEGTFSIRVSHKNKKNKPYYSLHVAVYNTDKEVIDWFHHSFGGAVNVAYTDSDKWNPVYKWYLYRNNNLVGFVKAIYPYLRIKKRHAEIMLNFCGLFDKKFYHYIRNEKGHIKEKVLREDIEKKRGELYRELRLLNKRGRLHGERLSGKTRGIVMRQSDL